MPFQRLLRNKKRGVAALSAYIALKRGCYFCSFARFITADFLFAAVFL